MITDDTHGFGMSGPTLYADRDRLEEHGIAYPSPVIDTDWDTDELLRRVIDPSSARDDADVRRQEAGESRCSTVTQRE